MSRKYKRLLEIWRIVCDDHPQQSDDVKMQIAVDLYNAENRNDEADRSDLLDAIERSQN